MAITTPIETLGKCGKLPVRTDVRTLSFARYVDTAKLPPPPPDLDPAQAVPDWPMYGNDRIGDMYLFIALDEETKLVPSFVLGKRNTANTEALMDDLARRIVVPPLFEAGPRPMVSTDGWAAYPNAVDGAFGGGVDYGTIIKDFQESEQPGRYGPPEMTGAVRTVKRLGSRPFLTALHSSGMDTVAPGRARGLSGATAVAMRSLRK